MRFVVDMNLSPLWVDTLAARGHDVVHWRTVGLGDAPDDAIIDWAVRETRFVLTADLDFAAAVAMRGLSAPSVVQLRSGSTDPDEVGDFVASAIETAGHKLDGGAILTIEAGHARLRPGPMKTT